MYTQLFVQIGMGTGFMVERYGPHGSSSLVTYIGNVSWRRREVVWSVEREKSLSSFFSDSKLLIIDLCKHVVC